MRVFSVATVLILIGFALPTLAQQPRKGWIGVTVESVTPAIKAQKKLASPFGALITRIAPESPAVSELRIGDVIFALNGRPVQAAESFRAEIEALSPDSRVEVTIAREREVLSIVMHSTAPPPPVIAAIASEASRDRRAEGQS